MSTGNKSYDVIIAGAGPAGTSAAIHLAHRNFSVLLVEKSTFPRSKLCGEFISPECVQHFERLGVATQMELSHPALVKETVFFSRRGRKTVVPSSWFGGNAALGLSRATMDDNLLNRARGVGVDILDGATVTKVIEDEDGVCGVAVKLGNSDYDYAARIIVDATGRGRSLARRVVETRAPRKPKLVAFKAHLDNTNASSTACEIYSYPGGYGGISAVENHLSNLCFIIDATLVREASSDPETVLRRNVMLNPRAAFTLRDARVRTEWLSVAIESFGRHDLSPVPGLLAIGDAASFIDPFTGSGMLMALESGELVAQTIVRHEHKLRAGLVKQLGIDYSLAYRKKFDSRLRVCSLLRRVAFRPWLAQITILVCASSDNFSGWLARATRSNMKQNPVSPAPLK